VFVKGDETSVGQVLAIGALIASIIAVKFTAARETGIGRPRPWVALQPTESARVMSARLDLRLIRGNC